LLKCGQGLRSPFETPDPDVLPGVDLIQTGAVVEQPRRQGRALPTALRGEGGASIEKCLEVGHGRKITGKFPDMSTGENPGIAPNRRSGHIPSMDLAERVQALIASKGLNPHSTAARAGLQEDTVRDILRGKVKDPGASKLWKLAQVLDVSLDTLLSDAPFSPEAAKRSLPSEIELPVSYTCAAGVWKEMDEFSQVEPRTEPAEYIPAYVRWPQWLEQVEGDSVDRLIPPGSLIHVVDTQAMGYEPISGDIVVVMRTRAGGFLRERTVKQIEITNGRIELWPRSHNPRYQEPIRLTEGAENDDGVTVSIVGKVLQAYMRFGKLRG